jgi:hypothetical protein
MKIVQSNCLYPLPPLLVRLGCYPRTKQKDQSCRPEMKPTLMISQQLGSLDDQHHGQFQACSGFFNRASKACLDFSLLSVDLTLPLKFLVFEPRDVVANLPQEKRLTTKNITIHKKHRGKVGPSTKIRSRVEPVFFSADRSAATVCRRHRE